MKRILSLTAIILLLATTQVCCYAQNKKVHNVIGRCEITRELSLAQAEERALEDAKINAMRKAGVSERLWSVTGLINEDDGSEFSQVLSRMTTLEINGLITVRDVVYSEEVIDGRRYAVATIDADVKLVDTKVDLTFQMEVNGTKGVYESGENMTFTVKLYGHIPMEQRYQRLHANIQKPVDQPVVIFDSFGIYRAVSARLDTRPGQGKTIGIDPQLFDEGKILIETVITVARLKTSLPVFDESAFRIIVPYAFPFTVLIPAALDLRGGRCCTHVKSIVFYPFIHITPLY